MIFIGFPETDLLITLVQSDHPQKKDNETNTIQEGTLD